MREAFGGARYGFAAALQMRGFPFLNGRSLGELCHIVQLALTERRLLGYRDGRIVPYDRSQTRLKEFSAKLQRPCTKVVSQGTRGSMPVATWDMARSLLRDLLVANDGQMKLPNVKRLFASKYGVQLSETVLGYAKVSGLLQDPRF